MRVKILSVIAVALMLGACNGKKQDSRNKLEAELQQLKEDLNSSADGSGNYVTPDLMLFELKGPVKTVKYIEGGTWIEGTLSFSPDGKLELPRGAEATIYRDSKDRIKSINYPCPQFESQGIDSHSYEFTLDDENRVKKYNFNFWEDTGRYSYYYDEKGNLIKTIGFGATDYANWEGTQSYTYISFDDYGNWIKRLCEVDGSSTDNDGYTESTSRSETEIREITYYE